MDLAFRNSLGSQWKPFHRLVSWVYRKWVIPFVHRTLHRAMREHGVKFNVVARQSASTGINFNAFASDLDLGVLLKREAGEDGYRALRRGLSRLTKRYKFLGEAEFYVESEWRQRQCLEYSNTEWLLRIRDLRKLTWMEEAFKKAPTEYHKRKALRSIQRIYRSLGCPELPPLPAGNQARLAREIQNLVKRRFGNENLARVEALLPRHPIASWTHFFAISIASSDTSSPEPNFDFVRLEKPTAAALLASIPSYGWPPDSEISNLANHLRKHVPAIAETFRITVEWEKLQFTAFLRSVEDKQPWMEQVQASLDRDFNASHN